MSTFGEMEVGRFEGVRYIEWTMREGYPCGDATRWQALGWQINGPGLSKELIRRIVDRHFPATLVPNNPPL